jgi:hypothetical protein
MSKDKRYEIQLPLDGRSKPVVYKVSGTGVVTIEKVDGKSADTLPAHEKDRILKAIKDAPRPGNELPEGEAGTKPGSDAGRPDNELPGRDKPVDPGYGGGRPAGDRNLNPDANPNVNPDVDKDAPRPGNELPGGPPVTPDNTLPESGEPKE